MKKLKLIAVSLFVFSVVASAATVTIPATNVNGTDVFSGPSFTLTSNVSTADLLTLTARGQVFLQPSNTYGTNAAGVVTTAGTTGVGGWSMNGSVPFGALLLGNSLYGFHQVYATGTAGNPLTVNAITLASIGFSSAMPSGTVLEFRISDINTGDNSGAFDVFGKIENVSTGAVPEPGTIGLLGAGLIGLALLRRRKA